MMKKAVAWFLLILFCLPLFIGCVEIPGEDRSSGIVSEENASASSASSEEMLSLTECYPDPTPEELPKAATLMGSRHLPPITSQGTTDACAAYSSVYYQFTAAVSTYLAATGKTDWNPSSGNGEQIFSPRFPFLRSGRSITGCYRALSEYGCLPITDCNFAVDNIPYLYDEDGKTPMPESSAWAVTAEENQKALAYRLTGHETVSLRETPFDDAMLMKMKTALALGNTIVLTTEISGWQYSFLDRDGCGSYGKIGDQIVFASAKSGQILNHAITIIGYDDDITCTVNGHTFRGAFQCANSSSTEWKNSGYCWILYDAFRETSECAALDSSKEDDHVLYTFTKTGKTSHNIYQFGGIIANLKGRYQLYTVQNDAGEYLSMTDTSQAEWTTEENASRFILMPFNDAKNMHYMDKTDLRYSKSFVILESETLQMLQTSANTPDEYRFMTFDLFSEMLESSVFNIDGIIRTDSAFQSNLFPTSKFIKFNRQAIGYRLDFIDWRTDIAVGLPERWIEFTVSAADRGNILTILQSDDSKITLQGMNGKPISFLNTPMTFSGLMPDKAETGTFAVCLDGLLRKDGWRLTLSGEGVSLLSAKLLDGSGQVLCEKAASGNAVSFEKKWFESI